MTDNNNRAPRAATKRQFRVHLPERSWLLGLVGLGILILSWVVAGLVLPLLPNLGIDDVGMTIASLLSMSTLPMLAATLVGAWIVTRLFNPRKAAQNEEHADGV
ncbi:MAG: hypothetical protein LBV00_07050 [Propionibacteriaceae bacterium]|jgi:hypothetical protein|nr:hypothetical protein [Propionibacteriaceae bacterium]